MRNSAYIPPRLDGYAVAPEVRTLAINDIVVDPEIHPRRKLCRPEVSKMAECLRSGGALPCSTVFHDGTQYCLADGFHRLEAHRVEGLSNIAVEVVDGTRRDAALYAIQINARHGLKLTSAEKRAAVLVLLNDVDSSERSDRELAAACGCSHPTVAAVRRQLAQAGKFTNGEVRQTRSRRDKPLMMTTEAPKFEHRSTEALGGSNSRESPDFPLDLCRADPNVTISDERSRDEQFVWSMLDLMDELRIAAGDLDCLRSHIENISDPAILDRLGTDVDWMICLGEYYFDLRKRFDKDDWESEYD